MQYLLLLYNDEKQWERLADDGRLPPLTLASGGVERQAVQVTRVGPGVTADRNLDWQGCFNARDLGGLRTDDGRTTRRGAVVRAESLDRLTAAGWSALQAHGI